MKLTKPPNDYLAQIDLQLKRLEADKMELEKKYGFDKGGKVSEKITIETLSKKKSDLKGMTTYGKNQRRYNFEKFREDNYFKTEKPRNVRPEISADWVVANKIKPDLKMFYDEGRFSKQMLRDEEFEFGKEEEVETRVFDSFMDSYALL